MPTAQDMLTINCPAKLNLTLAVGPPRDDGMHPIASIMVALDFGDELILRKLDHTPSTFERGFSDDAPMPQPIDWPIESDLIFRAHALMQEHLGQALSIACTINKRIPAGAGLGGGSANAAGMLVGLRKLFALPVPDQDLLGIAQRLGADVTFQAQAVMGQPAAFVSGIGEVITPIDTIPPFDCVLAFPDGRCPTPAVYRIFDQTTKAPHAPIASELYQHWINTHAVPPPHNDLTDAAIQACPAISTALQTIAAQGIAPRLTGSGSALYAVVESNSQAIAIAQALKQNGLAAQPARFSGLSYQD